MKEAISTNLAPAAVGPYSQAIKAGNFLYISGQLGIDPVTKSIVAGGVEAQAPQVFKNIAAILNAAGLTMNDIVKATVLLKDMGDFKKVNEIYATYFQPPYPARAAFAVKELPLSADIEIEAIALFP